jgi:hypothetical protein
MFGKFFDLLKSIFQDPKTESLLALKTQQVEDLRVLLQNKTTQLNYCYILLALASGLLLIAIVALIEVSIH